MGGQWATDPYGRAELRYWDGVQWTSHVSTRGVAADESAPAPTETPFSRPFSAPGAQQYPTQQYPTQQYLPQHGAQPYGYQPYAPSTSKASTDGKLIAAGIMTIIQGALSALAGIWLISLSQSGIGRLADEFSGGALTAIALVVLALAGALLTGGVGAVRGRNWGRILIIVLQAIFLVLVVLAIVDSPDDAAGATFYVIYCGVVLALAATSKIRQ